MIPAYSLNRAYSIFFVTFSVIGKQRRSLSVFFLGLFSSGSGLDLQETAGGSSHSLEELHRIYIYYSVKY